MSNPYTNRYYTFIAPIVRNRFVRTYSTLIFNLFAIALFTVFAIQPTIISILSTNKMISQEQSVLDALNTKTANITNGDLAQKAIDPSTLAKLNTLMPDDTDLPILTASLTNLVNTQEASFSGLQFQETPLVGSPTTLSKTPTMVEIPFTLNTLGSYEKLVSILNAVDSSQRLIKIDSITFNKPDSTSTTLLMSIKAKAYYLKN